MEKNATSSSNNSPSVTHYLIHGDYDDFEEENEEREIIKLIRKKFDGKSPDERKNLKEMLIIAIEMVEKMMNSKE